MTIAEALRALAKNVRVKLEVSKDDGTWLDLSDRTKYDQLVSMPGLSMRAERDVGSYDVQLSNLVLRNTDRFWDQAPPLGISTWKRHLARISLITAGGTASLGVWLLEDVQTRSDVGTATLTLKTLAARLVDKLADRVRDGKQWYQNQSIGFLVRRLLEAEFTIAQVAAWSNIGSRFAIPLADPASRALSAIARPPEQPPTVTPYGSPLLCVNDPASAAYGFVFLGLENTLWRWDPDSGIYTSWGSLPVVHAAKKIMHVFVNTQVVPNRVVVVAWEPELPTTNTAGDPSGSKTGRVVVCWGRADLPQTTLTQYAGEPGSIYTGHHFVRAGTYDATDNFTGIGAVSNLDRANGGVNLALPFGHWVRTNTSVPTTGGRLHGRGAWNAFTPGVIPQDDDSSLYWSQEGPGYASWSMPGDARPMGYRSSAGQWAGAFAHQNAGNLLVFTVLTWDGALNRYKAELQTLDTAAGAWSSNTGYFVSTGAEYHLPTSLQFRSDDAQLLVTATYFDESAWTGGTGVPPGTTTIGAPVDATSQPVGSAVAEYTWPLAGGGPQPTQANWFYSTNFSVAGGDRRRRAIVLHACYAAAGYALMEWFDYAFLGADCWGAAMLQLSGAVNTMGAVRYSVGRIAGGVYDAPKGRVYAHDAGNNQLISWLANTVVANPAVTEDSGFPPVVGDPALDAGIVWDKKRDALYGISGPGEGAQADPGLMSPSLTGKYYLWQFASSLADRIELADFTDLSLWDALSELAGVADFVFGFDASGNFFFQLRPAPTSTLGTIKPSAPLILSAGDLAALSISKTYGYTEIYNYAELTPSAAVLAPPTGTVNLLARPANFARDTWQGSVNVRQKDARAQNLFLRCVKGGQPGSEDNGVLNKDKAGNECVYYLPAAGQRRHALRFAFLLYDRVIESQMIVAVPGGIGQSNLYVPLLPTADGVPGPNLGPAIPRTGDVIEIAAPDGTWFRSYIKFRLDTPGTGTSNLRTEDDLPSGNYPVGTKVVIRSNVNNAWSDGKEGLTKLNDFNLIANEGDLRTWTMASTRYLTAGMVIELENPAGQRMEYLVLTVLNATQVKCRQLGQNPLPTGGSFNVGAVVRGYIAPIQNSVDYPKGILFDIGGTGVGLQFDIPAVQGATVPENPFMVGDTIDVECPGLSIQPQGLAKQIAVDQTSVLKFGQLPWPAGRNSRFLTFRQAQELVQLRVRGYGKPHFTLHSDNPLVLLPAARDCYLVRDPNGTLPRGAGGANPNGDLIPVSPDTADAVACVVRGFSVDPVNGKLGLDLRAVNPHNR